MAQTLRSQSPLALINRDIKEHPKENTFAAATLVLGLVALITAAFPGLHLVSSWAGLFGVLAGAYGQMISATTGERSILVVGLGASALGFFLGMSNGGLFGGLVG
ncbi:hypothetical protein GCM10010406_10430 [Streptomyces thermolineatus]|uniref:Integral membrane protein n=1 Tax=Streptomyces thermolineatus TaxID=44033 RepID=A0ABN3L551_9ACTN